MMCSFGEFWWIFLAAICLSFFIVIMVSRGERVGALICFISTVLLLIAAISKNDPRCKARTYLSVVERRTELVRECPDREKPSCQVQWIKYQQDSLSKYLRVLQ